jgi:hypothetical protein
MLRHTENTLLPSKALMPITKKSEQKRNDETPNPL